MNDFPGIYGPRHKSVTIESAEQLRDLLVGGFPKASGIPLKACRRMVSTIEQATDVDWPADVDREELLADARELAALCDEIGKLLGTDEKPGPVIGMKCFQLGRLVERILVRPLEPYVKTARKIKENPDSGARPTPKLEGVTDATICDQITAGFTYNTSMSTDRTRSIVIPLGTMYRYAVGFKHERRDGLTLGGGLTWIWEGNLPVKDAGGINNGQYNNAWIAIPSLYAKWEF